MASINRKAPTKIPNQENTKKVESSINVAPGRTRRAALGEIGNRVTNRRGVVPINTNDQLLKKKLTTKPPSVVKEQNQTTTKSKKNILDVPPVIKEKSIESKSVAIVDAPKTNLSEENTDAFSSDLLQIEDIDEEDKNNPLLVSIYSNDIYTYLRELEAKYPIQEGYLTGQEITPKMRSILIDWLVEVHQQFHLLQETLYLTVAILDRFLQAEKTITRRKLQLVGVTAMFIAAKYEETYPPSITEFVYITDNAYNKIEILQMEMLMTRTLDYSFGQPLSLHFLRRYSKAGHARPIHHTMAKYFLEQCLVNYEMCHYPPSLIAAVAMYLAFFIIGDDAVNEGKIIWTDTLVHYSTYSKEKILPIVHKIVPLVVNVEKSKYQAVRKKYADAKHMKISLCPELKSPSILALTKLNKE